MRRPSHSPTMSTNRRQRIFALIGFLNLNPIPLSHISNASHEIITHDDQGDSEIKFESSSPALAYRQRFCLPDDIPTPISRKKSPEDVDAFFNQLKSYTRRHPMELPRIWEKGPNWKHARKLSPGTRKGGFLSYCKEVEDIKNAIVYDYLNHNAPSGTYVGHPDIDDQTIPTFKMDCDLRQKTSSNLNKDIAGLYSGGKRKYILVQERLGDSCKINPLGKEDSEACKEIELQTKDIIFHEGTHFYNEAKWKLKGNPEYLASELFTDEELDLLGIQSCSDIDYDLLGEMASDGMQMMKSDFENAFKEWTGAPDHYNDEYRGKYLLLRKAYFIEIKNPQELGDYIQSLDKEDEQLVERVRLVGLALYTIAQRGMGRMSAYETGDVYKIAQR